MLEIHDKFLSFDATLQLAMKIVGDTPGLTPAEEDVFKLLVASCIPVETGSGPMFRLQDVRGFLLNLEQAIRWKDSSYLLQKRGLRVDRIVDVEEFCESPDYMNQRGHIRPVVRDLLVELFHSGKPYVECVLTGAIGWGKTFAADLAMAYMLYQLSCYHNPQVEYDLAPGSSIYFIQQSKKYELAKKVVFEQFSERLKMSPYFTKHFPFLPHVKSELKFPKGIHILPVGGGDTAALGMNVFGGIIDEMNFMARIVDSEQTRFTGEDEYDQAERVYRTLIRRMKSRFMQKGRLPGKLMLISSVNYPGDFTDRKVKEAKVDQTILAVSHSQWSALPEDRFSGEKFLVELGSEIKRARILKHISEAIDEEDVIHVPVEYYTDFVRDLEAALRDYAGETCGVSRPFIPYRQELILAQEKFVEETGRANLFKMHSVDLTRMIDPIVPNWGDLVDLSYIEDVILNRETPVSVHIDASVTGDATGLAVGRISGYKKLPAAKIYNHKTQQFTEIADVQVPVYHIDGALQIVPPANGEIDFELVRDLIVFLRGHLYVKWATMDSYQSTMMLQSFRKHQMRSGVLSVDSDISAYAEVKLAVKDERILLPQSEILARELRELEKVREKEKVDHREGGSKDVSDAVAGVVYILQHKEAVYNASHRRRPSIDQMNRESRPEERSGIRRVRIGRRL